MENTKQKIAPLGELMSDDTLLKSAILARNLTSAFVQYKVDAALQEVIRQDIREILQATANDCYAAGHADATAHARKEAARQREQELKDIRQELATELFRRVEISSIKQ